MGNSEADAKCYGPLDEDMPCPMCDGIGEIEAATIEDIGSVGCPQCIEREKDERIATLEDALIGAEIVIRMLAPSGQDVTLATIRRALRREE